MRGEGHLKFMAEREQCLSFATFHDAINMSLSLELYQDGLPMVSRADALAWFLSASN